MCKKTASLDIPRWSKIRNAFLEYRFNQTWFVLRLVFWLGKDTDVYNSCTIHLYNQKSNWSRLANATLMKGGCFSFIIHVLSIITIQVLLTFSYFTFMAWQGVLDTTLCDKDCYKLVTGRWFSPGTPDFSTNKTDRHNITEILLKVALNTINQTIFYVYCLLICIH